MQDRAVIVKVHVLDAQREQFGDPATAFVERLDEGAVARVLTGLLREVDPLTVIDGLDVVDEHEALPVLTTEPGVEVAP